MCQAKNDLKVSKDFENPYLVSSHNRSDQGLSIKIKLRIIFSAL